MRYQVGGSLHSDDRTAIELFDFQLDEAKPLLEGLKKVVSQPEVVLQEIIYWSGGQPFLTQKLCQLVIQTALKTSTGKIDLSSKTEACWVEELVRSHIIQDWESQDEPQHFRTIYETFQMVGLFTPCCTSR